MIQKQNSFSRSLVNEAKLGAYYTDLGHCKRIGQMFKFEKETCLLEPSIGDGSAVKSFLDTSKKGKEEISIYGVELNKSSFHNVRSKVSYCINADFLNEVRISNKVFSCCFANPPYGVCGDDGKDRLEIKFVEKIFNYLIPGGFLILIIPYSTMELESFQKMFLSRFKVLSTYKFDDIEYQKYKQIVLIAKRRKMIGAMNSEIIHFLNNLEIISMQYLPEEGMYQGLIYTVPESRNNNIDLFTTSKFNPQDCNVYMNNSNLYSLIDKKLFVTEYNSMQIGRPPLPLKKDFLYLCAVAGGGEGLAGDEANGDLHLQRGSIKHITSSEVEYPEEGETGIERVRTSAKISLNIINSVGEIIKLV